MPQDISLAGFDNRFFSKNQLPPLTTVELPLCEMGIKAGELLHAMILDEVVAPEKIQIPCKLIVRESTAALNEKIVLHERESSKQELPEK